MDIDQASVFLAGSILTGLGFIVVFITILVINNLLAKYWKPIQFLSRQDHPVFVYQDSVEPKADSTVTVNTPVTK